MEKISFFDSDFAKIISFLADSLGIVSILVVGIYGFWKRSSSLIGFKLNVIFIWLIKSISIILVWILVIKLSLDTLFGLFVLLIRNEWQGQYWERGEELHFLIAHVLYWGVIIPILAITSACIWQLSTLPIKRILIMFPGVSFDFKSEPHLEILNADYGSNANRINVTEILKKMVYNNKLTIKASNELAGDPAPNLIKELIIEYLYNGKAYSIIIKEGNIATIPESLVKKI